MGKTLVETLLSAVVLVVAAMFLWFAYTSANVSAVSGYPLTARFHTAAGIAAGSDVKMAGIKIGTVTGLQITPDTFEARVMLSVDPAIRLPKDSVASIAGDGLLGSNYLAIEPGTDKTTIPSGGELAETRSPEDITTVIGRMIYSPDN
jgi:phospholipid/cholesterol/gamma-HCH transport system substrate-binding protein